MPASLGSPEVVSAFVAARQGQEITVTVDQQPVTLRNPFASPAPWRDHWIYFLLVDRFSSPNAAARHLPFDEEHGVFQGGAFEGIRRQLGYLQGLGAGALWPSPVLRNRACEDTTCHGYGFEDFLRVEPRFCSTAAAATDPRAADAELQQSPDEAPARGIYVIFDIVLNHCGNGFDYDGHGATAPWRDARYPIHQPHIFNLKLRENACRFWDRHLKGERVSIRRGQKGAVHASPKGERAWRPCR